MLPWVDTKYATCTQRVLQAIAGISRAAMGYQAGVADFELFAQWAVIPTCLMYGDANYVQIHLETHSLLISC
jgi:hypothetical protein